MCRQKNWLVLLGLTGSVGSSSYKGLVAEALRQLLGEHSYKQDEVLPPGYYTGTTPRTTWPCSTTPELIRYYSAPTGTPWYCAVLLHVLVFPTDFVLWLDGSGRVLPIRSGPCVHPPCITVTTKSAAGAVAAMTAELQCFSPFVALEDGGDPSSPAANGVGGATEDRAFRPRPPDGPQAVTDAGPLDYGPYYAPAAQFYPGLAKEPSVESQDSSTLSSPPSDSAAPPPAAPRGPDSLFQFSIGKILEDEGAAATSEVQGVQMAGFYSEGATATRDGPDGPEQRHIRRLVPVQ